MIEFLSLETRRSDTKWIIFKRTFGYKQTLVIFDSYTFLMPGEILVQKFCKLVIM